MTIFRFAPFFYVLVYLGAGAGDGGLARGEDKPETTIDFPAELPPIPPTEPADTIAKFQLQPGFKIELVASEPLIRDPVAIDFDENGRLFVVEFPEYNQKHVRKQVTDNGRVRVLDDTDGDGVFDHSEIYVDNLSYPSSVACYDGGVFVAAAPEILYCKDTDGDDHADVRKVVFTGFGQEFQRAGQAQLNSFRWGLDNRIHVCTSFSGGVVVRPGGEHSDDKDSKPVNVRNRGFLFDPRTLDYGAASGGGQHGLAIDDWGRELRCRNSEPFKLLVYDERYLARNPYLKAPSPSVNILETGKHTKLFRISPDEPWRVLRTRMRTDGLFAGSNEGGKPFGFFTSATGVTVYRGDAWPEAYRGSALVGEVANNLVFRAKLEPSGVGLVARRADADAEFVASTDNWFRPVQLANGPDGGLYVVDMYRELIEGASFLPPEFLQHINVTGGVDRGRIYRVVPDDFLQPKSARLGDARTSELVAMLEHVSGWHRDTAARLLYTRQDRSAVGPLKKLAKESRVPVGRVHALHALEGLSALDQQTVCEVLADPHPRVREHAIRLAESFAESPVARQHLLSAVDDRDLLVRFQVAFSLGALRGEDRIEPLIKLVRRDGEDSWFRLAILSSIGDQQGEAFTALLADSEVRQSKQGRLLLTELASQIAVSGKVADVQSFAEAIETLSTKEAGFTQSLIRRIVVDAASPTIAATLSEASDNADEILRDLLETAQSRAVDTAQSDASRVSAIKLLRLLDFEHVQPIVRRLMEVQQSPAVQVAAVELLARSDRSEVASILLQRWPTLSPVMRAQVFETLASRRQWLEELMDAVEANEVARGDIDPARITILTAHPSESIRKQAKRIFGPTQSVGRRRDVVQAYQPALDLSGNAARGREHFRRVCSACHRLEQIGTAVGADLKAIRNRGMPAIMLNILDPNREVTPQFLTYVVLTADGRVHTGMIQSESANSITLRRPDDQNVTLLRIDIEDMRSTGLSFMPEGLEAELDHQAMADLLAYFNSIK